MRLNYLSAAIRAVLYGGEHAYNFMLPNLERQHALATSNVTVRVP